MGAKEPSQMDKLIDYFLSKLSEGAEKSDWKEADGWVGKWTITGKIMRVYEVSRGRLIPTTERGSYTGAVEMSEDTFLDLMQAALEGKAEDVFAEKYGRGHIRYEGDQWIVDSERFRSILRKVGKK